MEGIAVNSKKRQVSHRVQYKMATASKLGWPVIWTRRAVIRRSGSIPKIKNNTTTAVKILFQSASNHWKTLFIKVPILF